MIRTLPKFRLRCVREVDTRTEKRKVASIIYGEGIGLSWYDPVTGDHDYINWPDDWPESVDVKFLEAQGYEVEYD